MVAARLISGLLILVYGGLAILNPGAWRFLDYVNLIIHEAGHPLFALFGETIGIAGGSIMQLLVPAVFVGYFLLQGQLFEGGVVLFWLADSLLYLANYVGDARAQVLPLLGGDGTIHDWNFLLGQAGWLEADAGTATAIRLLATITWVLSVSLCFWTAWHLVQPVVPQGRPGVVTMTGRRTRYRAARGRDR